MKNDIDTVAKINKALSNEKRLQIILWLKAPTANFPKQRDGDLVEDGVCLGAIADKLGVSQPTATAYMRTLAEAGLVGSKRIKQWTFHKLKPEGFIGTYGMLSDLIADAK
ncbi:MAG: ArsR/SmtB family transcription factor [Kordiimonas sp.]